MWLGTTFIIFQLDFSWTICAFFVRHRRRLIGNTLKELSLVLEYNYTIFKSLLIKSVNIFSYQTCTLLNTRIKKHWKVHYNVSFTKSLMSKICLKFYNWIGKYNHCFPFFLWIFLSYYNCSSIERFCIISE